MKNFLKRRSGFAMVIAIVMIALVALTLSLLGSAMMGEVRRTKMLAEDAQLREMLQAGAMIRGRLEEAGKADGGIELPADLKAREAELKIVTGDAGSADEKIVEIEASFPKHRVSEKIHFKRDAGLWQIRSASLDE